MVTSQRIQQLKEKVALLPDSPGVYQFLGDDGKVIYVGKAKNLKRRVSSYFLARADHSPKVRVMVGKIADLRHTVVATESEALLLENNMIKSIQPRYNILLKDDKTYPWIVIRNEPFPRVLSTRRFLRDGSQYFGPYASVYIQKEILEILRGIYQLRTCSLNLSPEAIANGRYSVCLEYHIGNCKGPCVGRQSEEEYRESIGMVASLLKGDTRATRDYLQRLMNEAAAEMRFEDAGRYKKRLDLLAGYQSKSVVVSNTLGSMDVFSLIIDDGVAFCNFMRIVQGAVVNSFTVELKPGLEDEPRDVLSYAVGSIRDRLQGLHGDGTPVVLLAVYGNRDYEHALDDLDRFMTERGFVTVAAGTFVGEHSYSTPQTPVAAGRPDVADWQLARRFGEKVRDKLAGYEPGRFVRLEVARIPRPELSWLDKLRFVWYGLGLKVLKKPMPVAPVTDPGQCNGCGVCAIVCPTGAIAAGNELHTDASRCIRCCACVKSCRRTARSFDTPFAKILTACCARPKQPHVLL